MDRKVTKLNICNEKLIKDQEFSAIDGWEGEKAGLRIAYSNEKINVTKSKIRSKTRNETKEKEKEMKRKKKKKK